MIKLTSLDLDGQTAKVWTGGSGPPLLLIHGAWAGAAMHWQPVWEQFAARYQVVAPELPGIGDLDRPGLPSMSAYASWLEAVLQAMQLPAAWVVGNSFGAAAAWRLAGQAAALCKGVVLVNGGPMPIIPALARWLVGLPPLRQMTEAFMRRVSFSAGTLTRAFADPGHAPPELVRMLARRSREAPPQVKLIGQMMLADEEPAPSPTQAVLLLWGEEDRLWGLARTQTHKLQRSIPGAQLVLIPDAGHLPQVEQPERFVAALHTFIEAH